MFTPFLLRNKSVITILLVSLLLFVGHYYFYVISVPMFWFVNLLTSSVLASVCLCGVVFLLFYSRHIRSSKVLAFEMGLFALASIVTIVVNMVAGAQAEKPQLLSPAIMIYGNTYAYICLLYPISLVHLGKIGIKRYILLFLPALVSGVFYYVVIYAFHLPMTEIHSWQDLVSNIGRFDVWFRFTIFIYPVWMLIKIFGYRAKYQKWCQDNYSDSGYIDLTWIDSYFLAYFILLCSYTIVMLGYNPQNLMIHKIGFILFFSFCIYGVIHQATPPSEVDQGSEDDQPLGVTQPDNQKNEISGYANLRISIGNEIDKSRFEDKIPQYKAVLEEWMERAKPYQNKDFKLLDVMDVLPLNRSYLSRMFNEGYGETFLGFVMRYRINDSVSLLINQPDISLATIAELCGFSSPSVFGRAFLKAKGTTPKQYRSLYCRTDCDVA